MSMVKIIESPRDGWQGLPKVIGPEAKAEYLRALIAAGFTHIKMAIGGAPISQMFADEIGADGYGANASAAVDLFMRLADEG